LTRKKQLNKQTLKNTKKKLPIKRLEKTWLTGNERRIKNFKKVSKTKMIKDNEPILNTNGKSLIDTAFVQRVTNTRLAKKNKKPKHIEQDFADKPAPRAEKRKRLLTAAKEISRPTDDNEEVPTLVDSEERKIKSGGRSKKKVRRNPV